MHNDSDDFTIEVSRKVENLVGTSEFEYAKRRDSIKKAKSPAAAKVEVEKLIKSKLKKGYKKK